MSALTITTFGEPSVRRDARALSFPARKPLAIALHLAVVGRDVPRGQLGSLLWPEADEQQVFVSVRQALYRLRQTLEPAAEEHLLTHKDRVALALGEGGTIDIQRLEAALLPDASLADYEAALAAYQGPFLAHFDLDDAPDFTDWVEQQRAYWEGCFDLIATRYLQALHDEGEMAHAIRVGQRWVTQRPLHEPAYHALVNAQLQAGNVVGAQVTLQRLTHELAHMRLVPSAATVALQHHVARLPLVLSHQPTHPHTVHLPLVGRHVPFALLRQSYLLATEGVPQVSIVQAGRGIGKSRLLAEFAAWAEGHDALVLAGRARDYGGRLAYQAAIDALRPRVEKEHAPDDRLADVWLVELSHLLPELRDRYPDLPPSQEDAALGMRIAEAVWQLVQSWGREHPIVWCLDDAQWSDAATRDLLYYVLDQATVAAIPLLLVVSLSTPENEQEAAPRQWLPTLERAYHPQHITLAPLTPAAVQRMLDVLLPESDESFTTWFADITAGNPGDMTRVLRDLLDRGVLAWGAEGQLVPVQHAPLPKHGASDPQRDASASPAAQDISPRSLVSGAAR